MPEMNLNDYFDPIDMDIELTESNDVKDQIFSFVKIHSKEHTIRSIEGFELAILGVVNKHSGKEEESLIGLNEIRKYFYQLTGFSKNVKIYDLGNLKSGNTPNDLVIGLRDVIVELFSLNIIPIIIGDSEDILYPNYMAYQKFDKEINLVSIDSKIRITEDRKKSYKSSLWKIIVENNDSLFNFYNIGYQTHFVSSKIIKYLADQLHFAYRLGYIRNNLKEVEPVFRDADLIGLNISSIRQSDAFGQSNASPNGYYGEEICQLARYAGMSSKLSSFGIFDYNQQFDINLQTAHLIAQIMWYFVDGFLNKINEYPLETEGEYKKFIVNINNAENELIFYKSEKTNRWWVEVPSIKKNFTKQFLISCTYDDYLEAGNGDIPQKWLKAFQKLN